MRQSRHATFGARFAAAAIVAALAACTDRQPSPASQSASPAPAGPQVAASSGTPAAPQAGLPPSRPMPADARPLGCGLDGFERDTTHERLVSVFGADAVSDMQDEEEGFGSIVLFADDPRRELVIRFAPAAGGRIPESVEVSGPDSVWVLNGGFRIGDSLETAEQYNGQAFTLFGLVSTSWQGGAMEKPDCYYWVNLSAAPGPAIDAREYRSDDPALRAQRPSIVRLGFTWVAD